MSETRAPNRAPAFPLAGPSDPRAYLKHAARGYHMVFRGLGKVEAGQRTRTSIDLEFSGLMPVCFDPEIPWVRYSRAAYRLAFEFSGTAGTIDLPDENPQLRTARLHCHWVLEGEATGAERDSP